MSGITRCESCGAPMQTTTVTAVGCVYCGAEVRVSVDSGQIAKGMALDLANAEAFMTKLSAALTHGFGDRAKIQREGSRIVLLELHLDPDVFIARREYETIIGQHKKLVRGIALKTATHPLDRWVEMLTTAIAVHANSSATAAQALAQIRVQ